MGFIEDLRRKDAENREAERKRLEWEKTAKERAREEEVTRREFEKQRPYYWQQAKDYFEESRLRGMLNEMVRLRAIRSIHEDKDYKWTIRRAEPVIHVITFRVGLFIDPGNVYISTYFDGNIKIEAGHWKSSPSRIRYGEWKNNKEILEKSLEKAYKSEKDHEDGIRYNDGHFCLPGNSLISVPDGFVPIKNIKSGDLVWTVDKLGHKAQSIIIQKIKKHVSKDHKMVHIVLNDGRELFASVGHPSIDNKMLGELREGQILDKAKITSVQIISYRGKYTHDILPSGETGGYWANNILIGSTLSSKFCK